MRNCCAGPTFSGGKITFVFAFDYFSAYNIRKFCLKHISSLLMASKLGILPLTCRGENGLRKPLKKITLAENLIWMQILVEIFNSCVSSETRLWFFKHHFHRFQGRGWWGRLRKKDVICFSFNPYQLKMLLSHRNSSICLQVNKLTDFYRSVVLA